MAVPGELARAYRGRVIFGPFAPMHPEEVSALEGEIGQPIPPAYRSFLEVANGGTLAYSVRVPPGPDGEIMADYAVNRGSLTRDQADAWTEDLRQLGRDGRYFFSLNRYLFLARR